MSRTGSPIVGKGKAASSDQASAEPCGSASISKVRPRALRLMASAVALVVLPVPPLRFTTASRIASLSVEQFFSEPVLPQVRQPGLQYSSRSAAQQARKAGRPDKRIPAGKENSIAV